VTGLVGGQVKNARRDVIDRAIIAWAAALTDGDLAHVLHYANSKGIKGSMVVDASPDIKVEDVVLLRVNETFNGYGVAKSDNLKDASVNTVKIRKIGSGQVRPNEKLSTIADAVSANKEALVSMEKDAINAIKGVASQGRNRELPIGGQQLSCCVKGLRLRNSPSPRRR